MTQNSVTAQDTLRITRGITRGQEFTRITRGPQQLVGWANTWQMNFNIEKCAVMHIGHNNIQHNCTMANQQLKSTEEQLDLGITITRDLK